jgi:hypothetical protein
MITGFQQEAIDSGLNKIIVLLMQQSLKGFRAFPHGVNQAPIKERGWVLRQTWTSLDQLSITCADSALTLMQSWAIELFYPVAVK